jgi:predicted PurR-regulated permease PerM
VALRLGINRKLKWSGIDSDRVGGFIFERLLLMWSEIPNWVQAILSVGGVFAALTTFLWRTSSSVSTIVRNQVTWLEDHQEMKAQLSSLLQSHQELKESSVRISTKLEDVEKDLLRLQGMVDHTNKVALTIALQSKGGKDG